MNKKHLPLLALFLLGLASAAHAGVLAVGPGGFSTIRSAIRAANPGDTILVTPGTYSSFVVDKPLRILGAGSQFVWVDDVIIRQIPLGLTEGELMPVDPPELEVP